MTRPIVAYIMSRFPNLTETFILREMNELERQGQPIALYPLIVQQQSIVHAEAQAWLPRIRHTSPFTLRTLNDNLRELGVKPGEYLSIWRQALSENISSPNLWLRVWAVLPQAVWSARKMMEDDVAHVHAHYATHPALAAWVIHRLTGLPFSFTIHAHDLFVRTSMLETKAHESKFIVAISEYNRERLANTVGVWAREKTFVVHCGIDQANYASASARQEKKFEVVCIGSLQEYKGHPYLIRACAILKERGMSFRCRIIGQGEDRLSLLKLIAEEGVEDVVELLGPRSENEVASILQSSDCYVQPSIITSSGKMEGIPVALMEALACALPVVATSISGIPELVRPNETGLLVSPESVNQLVDAIMFIYNNPEEAARLGASGRDLVVNEFGLRENASRLLNLFHKSTVPAD